MWLKVAVFTHQNVFWITKYLHRHWIISGIGVLNGETYWAEILNKYCTWRASRCLDLSKLRYAFLWICFGMSTFCMSMRQPVSACVSNCAFNVWIHHHPISTLQQLLSRCQQNMVYSAIKLISIMIMENLPKAVHVSHQLTIIWYVQRLIPLLYDINRIVSIINIIPRNSERDYNIDVVLS